MSLIFELDGAEIAASPPGVNDADGRPLLDAVHRRIVFDATRAIDAAPATIELADDDPVCVQLSDGLAWWMQAGEAARVFGRFAGAGTRRVAFGADLSNSSNSAAARGRGKTGIASASKTLLHALDVFHLGACATAATLAAWYEQQQSDGLGIGLHRISFPGGAMQLSAAPPPAGDRPLLLFIHGTASFCAMTFRHLCSDDAASCSARHALQSRYGDAIYGWQYRSLTVGPIENALALLHQLPDRAQLHLVAHSQGGLLGELLCLGQRNDGVLTPHLLDTLFARDRAQAAQWGYGAIDDAIQMQQREQIGQLLALLDQKQIRVQRFVRIACPALGTTLASGRLDRWLSMLRFAASVGGLDLVTDRFLAFILAVVKQRTDPRTLPGLEAMMPGSALIRLLNWDALRVDADLSVIAGSATGGGALRRMELLLADRFFGGAHDMVVNTGSMYGGLRRSTGGRFYCAQNAHVSHFRYLARPETVALVAAGLLRADRDDAGYTTLAAAPVAQPLRAAPPRQPPLAIVLPAILGCDLQVGDTTVWLDLCEMADGGVRKLAIDARGVTAGPVSDNYYGRFIAFLGATHEVLTCPFDWRTSIRDSALQLAALVEARLPALEAAGLPLHIVAHSMGGLVARAMFALRPQLWTRALALPGFRLMMLGTPNGGCYQTVRLLTGQHYLANWLSLLDLRDSRDDILGILVRYPGIADMLPWVDADRDYGDPATWDKLKHDSGDSWPVPDAGVLAGARATWDLLRAAPVDGKAMLYVAGWATETADGVALAPDPVAPETGLMRLHYAASRRGDGTVLWDQGRVEGVPMWYAMTASHAHLLAHAPLFDAYLDLLRDGTTTQLPNAEPDTARAALFDAAGTMAPDVVQYQPVAGNFAGFGNLRDARDSRAPDVRVEVEPVAFASAADAGASAANAVSAAGESGGAGKVALRLCHGDLLYAEYPVGVGHYENDAIVSAELQLDRALGGMLSTRARLGLYPGQAGTWHACIAPLAGAGTQGALVVGLGQVGELTAAKLEATLHRALLDYGLTIANWHDDRFGHAPQDGGKATPGRAARLSFLLVGSGAGGVQVADSLSAMLHAIVKANDDLARLALPVPVRFDRIDFLELFDDIAMDAAKTLAHILTDPQMQARFDWPLPVVTACPGGLRRAWREDAPNWWERLEIGFNRQLQQLHFVALTDRARAEQTLLAGQTQLAMDFVAQAVAGSARDQDVARTLFEMLTPEAMKLPNSERRDTVLLLDLQSACLPWELLEDRWNAQDEPRAVAAGLIRQLKVQQFRVRPAHATLASALVVGNPYTGSPHGAKPRSGVVFPDLPGARLEAESVGHLLGNAHYAVSEEIGSDATNILIALHADAYRILHLAGHGVFELAIPGDATQPARVVSGMAIGQDRFLTPADVAQMRWVPELVFVNCCHLGVRDGGDGPPARHHELAANLGAQFIEMGVKAVVAAGWAVDDAAANAFALAFYRALLAGARFGEAVRIARKSIYAAYPGVNTWGAYQCYGDPNFALAETGFDGDAATREWLPQPYYSSLELEADLHNFAVRAGLQPQSTAQLDALLARIPAAVQNAWLAQVAIAGALALARTRATP